MERCAQLVLFVTDCACMYFDKPPAGHTGTVPTNAGVEITRMRPLHKVHHDRA
jgi:hypothetical protein